MAAFVFKSEKLENITKRRVQKTKKPQDLRKSGKPLRAGLNAKRIEKRNLYTLKLRKRHKRVYYLLYKLRFELSGSDIMGSMGFIFN